jgi:hypothetical protein
MISLRQAMVERGTLKRPQIHCSLLGSIVRLQLHSRPMLQVVEFGPDRRCGLTDAGSCGGRETTALALMGRRTVRNIELQRSLPDLPIARRPGL